MEINKMKVNDYVKTLSSEELYNMLSDSQKEYVFNQVRFQNVKEDVESQIDQNPDLEGMSEEQVELLANDVASRYVFDGEGDAELPYWDQINNLIEESSYYAEHYSNVEL